MKKQLFSIFSVILATFASHSANGQYYNSAPISGGYNTDVIANGTGSSAITTDSDVDGVSFAFVSKDFLLTSASAPLTYGLPVSGNFNSVVASTPGLPYQLGPYTGNNNLRLPTINDNGTLTLATPVAATSIYILATSGSGTSTVSAKISFTDATSQNVTGLAVADWYNATGFALQGIGRINRQNDVLENGGGTNPRLYQIPIAIDAANQSKQIESVTFIKTAGTGITNIFAISVNQYTTCPAPTLIAATNLTQTSATINWTAPTVVPSNGYEIYYSTVNVAPTSATTPSVTGVTGLSTSFTGLTPNTVYYVWVRSNCSGIPGPWGLSSTFKTACGAVATMSEDFESYATGNIVPDCWARLVSGSGSMSISSTTPTGSGVRQIYQYSSTAANSTVVVLPVFSNINAGTNWLKMKTRSSTTVGSDIQIGYVTDAADAATFVSLFDVTVNNLVYTDLAANRTFVIPNTVPANARLAVKNKGTKTGSFYWDDVVWEAIPSCQEPFNPVKTGATTTSIALSWTAPATAPATYDIYYSTSNVAPTSASTPQITGVTGNSSNITGLTASTTYYFWLRSNCGTSQSAWVGVVSAYTGACLPTGGSTSTTYYLNNITTTGGFTNLGYTASSYNAYVDNSSTTLNSVAGGVINYTLGTSSGTNYYYIWIDYNNDLDFDDADETILATTSYTAGATGNFTIPVTVPQGNYRMRFAQSYIGAITACGPAPYGSYVDYTLSLGAPPTCIAPTAVLVSAVSSVGATVNWTASITPPAGGYDVYYSTTNTPPTAATTPNANVAGTTAILSGLSPATTYYVWVRAHCSAADLSSWSTSATFTTACAPVAIPFIESFSSGTAPNCWTTFSTDNTANAKWKFAGTPDYGASPNGSAGGTFAWVDASVPYTGVHDVTLQTPQINLVGITTPMVQFRWFKNHLTGAGGTVPAFDNNQLTVMVRDIATATWDVIFTNSTNDAAWRTVSINLPASYVGKTIELRFVVDKDLAANGYFYDDLLLDDLEVKQSTLATSEVNTNANLLTVAPNPFKDIIKISDVKDVVSISIVDLSGRLVKTVKPAREINLGDLKTGMYLINLKMKDGSVQTVKAIKR